MKRLTMSPLALAMWMFQISLTTTHEFMEPAILSDSEFSKTISVLPAQVTCGESRDETYCTYDRNQPTQCGSTKQCSTTCPFRDDFPGSKNPLDPLSAVNTCASLGVDPDSEISDATDGLTFVQNCTVPAEVIPVMSGNMAIVFRLRFTSSPCGNSFW